MIVSIFIIISTMNAMEVEKVCHLASIPAEIQNHIASYLPFNIIESDEEFIERTRVSGTISEEHLKLLEQQEQAAYEWGKGSLGILRAYSINCSKIISLEKIMKDPKVTIFDIHSKTTQESTQLANLFKEDTRDIGHIALSHNGTRCAQLQKKAVEINWLIEWQRWIIIKSTLSDEKQEFPILNYYDNFISIGFNKQGTKIIVHAKEDGCWGKLATENDSFYHIIPLTSLEEHEEKSKKTLKAYLRHICCCKDLTNNLPTS